MTTVDWIALAIVGLAALSGLRRGLVTTALSLAGLVAGAFVGARVAPHFLHNGAESPYTPLVGAVGAIAGALLLQSVASTAGAFARRSLWVLPPLKLLDTAGGLLAGAALGLATFWVAGVAILQVPVESSFRTRVQESVILKRLDAVVSPRTFLRALASIDPLSTISGPAPPATALDPAIVTAGGVTAARRSVVRVKDTACGIGIEGSGWVAAPHLVVTAAHVVEGGHGITAGGHRATALLVDRSQDIAVLRVPRLRVPALGFGDPHEGDAVAILGYPANGPFDAQPARIGSTADVVVSGLVRAVTALSGIVRHGNSGGPAVNAAGKVESTIFAARAGSTHAGYGLPASTIRSALARARRPVSTGGC